MRKRKKRMRACWDLGAVMRLVGPRVPRLVYVAPRGRLDLGKILDLWLDTSQLAGLKQPLQALQGQAMHEVLVNELMRQR